MAEDTMAAKTESSPHLQSSTSSLCSKPSIPSDTDDWSSTSPESVAGIPPDGGLRAWLVVVGGTCNVFATFGFINCWGAFQEQYLRDQLRNVSTSNIGWIGSTQYSLVFLPGIICGRLFDLGYFKIPQCVASIILVAATLLIGQCHTYWQFLLCQGVVVGLACGCLFGPTFGCVSQWFDRRRATALGIVAMGSSVGGAMIPVVFRSLISKFGFAWTMRTVALIMALALGVSNLTLQRRLPPKHVTGNPIDVRAFKHLPFAVYAASGFITFLGSSTLLSYLAASAVLKGVSPGFSIYLLSIANASSAIGRVMSGPLADRVGAMNVLIPFTAAAGVITCVWPYADEVHWFIVVAASFGIACGAYVSLSVVPIVAMGEADSVGGRIGAFQSCTALGAMAGIPISGRIRDVTHGYNLVGAYAGTMLLLGVALMFVTRCLMLRQMQGKI